MQNYRRFRLIAAVAGLGLLTSAYYRNQTSSLMVQTANSFLASLTAEQKEKAVFKFDDEERLNWHFIPKERKGLPLKDMTAPQKHLAQALLSAGLSQRGYIKAVSVMSMEDVLRALENDSGVRRNPDGYFFSIFGQPADDAVWGYRVEGHHLSQNFTIVKGVIAGSPSFYGSNPAEVRDGPRKGMRILAREEDLGRDLLTSLTPDQKAIAIIDKTAYKDIITMASRKAALEGKPSGLHASKMTSSQRAKLQDLLEEYANNMPGEAAESRLAQVKAAGGNIYFAWTGVEERSGPHYYRIQAPKFLIEYDNTQNGANHIHSVWRDFEGDFGSDLLKQHYQASH